MATLNENIDPRDPLFKGCTRPPMIFGVPVTALFIICGPVLIVSLWTKIYLVATLIPIVLVMRSIAKTDDQQFRLLFLKMRFRVLSYNHNGRFWRSSAYSPLAFKKRK